MSIINTVPMDNSETLYNVTLTSTTSSTYRSIIATVTSSAADVVDWISNILSFHARRLDSLIVGLDVEWRPSYSRHQNPVALLQLCVGTRCLLFQLIHADSIPAQLFSFLSDPRFKFVGVGIDEDVEKLIEDYEMSVRNTVDLRVVAAEVYGRREMKQMGIVKLADEVVGVEVRKPKSITMSRWDQEYLMLDQIGYACIDAFLSFEIGRRLIAG